MNEKRERRLRRQAIRWDLQGRRPKAILQSVSRSRTWFAKCRHRYQRWGWAGLRSQSRRPHHSPTRVSAQTRRLVIRVRRRLQRRKLGLVGARAIRRELRQSRLLRHPPSESTIKRIVRHLEVGTRRTQDWERAIFQGYAAFRHLLAKREAVLHLDLRKRELAIVK